MAGSYQHCDKNDDGRVFYFDMIENMGDAHEAAEMMFYMIGWLAKYDRKQIEAASNAYFASKNPEFTRAASSEAADVAEARAVNTLTYYFKLIASGAGVKWTADNNAEIAGVVSDIAEAGRLRARE